MYNICTCLKYQENVIQINKNIQYKNNGAMDIGNGHRETVLSIQAILKHTFSRLHLVKLYMYFL